MWKQKMTNCRKRVENENLEGELEDVPEEEHEQGVGGEALGQDAATLEDEDLKPNEEETKTWDAGGKTIVLLQRWIIVEINIKLYIIMPQTFLVFEAVKGLFWFKSLLLTSAFTTKIQTISIVFSP